jgi:hypothetical protein
MNSKNSPSKKRTFTICVLLLLLVAGCSREIETPPPATQTAGPSPFDVTYCDINPSGMCLEGFGLNADERLLILFKAAKPRYRNIYIRADVPDGENHFECQQSGNSQENVYCLGDPIDEKELIKLNIYAIKGNKLIAIGVFNVQLTSLPEPDVKFGAATTPTPASASAPASTPSYPNPSGPTPSYPNPTSAP